MTIFSHIHLLEQKEERIEPNEMKQKQNERKEKNQFQLFD